MGESGRGYMVKVKHTKVRVLLGVLAAVLVMSSGLTTTLAASLPELAAPSAAKSAETVENELFVRNGAIGAPVGGSETFTIGQKNSVGLCNFVEKARSDGWRYVYGAKGQRMSSELIEAIIASSMDEPRSPYRNDTQYMAATRQQAGNRATDCSGLIKSYLWWNGDSSDPMPAHCPDAGGYNSNSMLDAASEKGTMATMPEMPGLVLHRNGHVGIYVGQGRVIEARGVRYGVTMTEFATRSWTYWSKCPWVDYDMCGVYRILGSTVFLDHGENIGEERWTRKYILGDETAGSAYVPVAEKGATFRGQTAAAIDPDGADGIKIDPTLIPVPGVSLMDRMLAVLEDLPYDEALGYRFEGHWYLLKNGEDGSMEAVLNDPKKDGEEPSSSPKPGSSTSATASAAPSADIPIPGAGATGTAEQTAKPSQSASPEDSAPVDEETAQSEAPSVETVSNEWPEDQAPEH